jgi:hypothetical protein
MGYALIIKPNSVASKIIGAVIERTCEKERKAV